MPVALCTIFYGYPRTYTPPESMDRGNVEEGLVELDNRCSDVVMNDLEHRTRGQILNSSHIVREAF